MEENARLIHDYALAGAMQLIEGLERRGVKIPRALYEEVFAACRANIECYIQERNRGSVPLDESDVVFCNVRSVFGVVKRTAAKRLARSL